MLLSLSVDRFIIYLYTRSYLYHVIIGPLTTSCQCYNFLSVPRALFSLSPRIIPAVLPSNHSRPADTSSHSSFRVSYFLSLFYIYVVFVQCILGSLILCLFRHKKDRRLRNVYSLALVETLFLNTPNIIFTNVGGVLSTAPPESGGVFC
jgi:hypothetical protein